MSVFTAPMDQSLTPVHRGHFQNVPSISRRCPCEVKVLLMLECAPSALENCPVSSDEHTDSSFTTLNAFSVAPLCQRARVQSLFLTQCFSQVALYRGFSPQCCTSSLRSRVNLKVLFKLYDTLFSIPAFN